MVNTIAIIVAMEGEAMPMIQRLNLEPKAPKDFGFHENFGRGVYQRDLGDKKIFLITNGKDKKYGLNRVSTQPAAVTAYAVIDKLKPDLIISAGTAGGMKDSEIGDVYLSNNTFVYIDRIINLSENDILYGEGHYNYSKLESTALTLGLKLGRVGTGSSLDPSLRDLEQLSKLEVDVVDMEAAAVAEQASEFGVEMMAVKSVTNFLDDQLHTDFENNYKLAVENLAKKVESLITFLIK